jgi:hypothetical protein
MQGEDRGEANEKSNKQNLHTYINKVDKKAAIPYLIKNKKNGNMIAIKANKQANKGKGDQRMWVPKEIISTMKSIKNAWVLKGKCEVRRTSRNLET